MHFLWCRLEYFLGNWLGVPPNSWQTSITTVNGPAYTATFDTLTNAPYSRERFRVFSVRIPVGSTSVRLRFTGSQVGSFKLADHPAKPRTCVFSSFTTLLSCPPVLSISLTYKHIVSLCMFMPGSMHAPACVYSCLRDLLWQSILISTAFLLSTALTSATAFMSLS